MKEKMNKILSILLGVGALLTVTTSCEEELVDPVAKMSINKTQLEVNESMVLNFSGVADQVVVYTGDTDHDYELRDQTTADQQNTGFAVNKGRFSYSYSQPGTYKVVCVASTFTEKATELKRDTCSFTVKVIDDHTEITRLSCPKILYDEVYAEAVNDSEWLMRLPIKAKYNKAAPTISLSQTLKFYIASEFTKVQIDGADYESATKYDLSKPHDIHVISDFGTTRDYKLYTVQYPEFKSFTVAGVKGTIDRDAFEYGVLTVDVEVPAGTDLTKLTPEFTLYSDDTVVSVGNSVQTSGQSTVDFTNPITYKLVSSVTGKPEMQAISQITVTVTTK